MSRLVMAVMVAGIVGLTACSSSEAVAPSGPEKVALTFKMVLHYDEDEDVNYLSDTANVNALVVDHSGAAMLDASVDWQLNPGNDPNTGLSIATIEKTGPLTARVVFQRPGIVGIVASVTRDDGSKVSSALYVISPRSDDVM